MQLDADKGPFFLESQTCLLKCMALMLISTLVRQDGLMESHAGDFGTAFRHFLKLRQYIRTVPQSTISVCADCGKVVFVSCVEIFLVSCVAMCNRREQSYAGAYFFQAKTRRDFVLISLCIV